MRTLRISIFLLLLVPTLVLSQTTGVSYQKLTVAGTAVGLATATIMPGGKPVKLCRGVVLTAAVNYRYDGPVPTATEGMPLAVGAWVTVEGYGNLTQFRAIRTTSDSGELRFTCER
jgi:hypothetical protein